MVLPRSLWFILQRGVKSESSSSSPLCAQFLRPKCRRFEVSSTGGHRSSSRRINIGFSTSHVHNFSISRSCSTPSLLCLFSVVADSPLMTMRSGEKCDLQYQWRSIIFFNLVL
ncbi:Uncharacterized protein Rs2_38843 [Raphanus sativus]|nr:Uncharacterized protein Rs2_38843 [Raphanus sativus]